MDEQYEGCLSFFVMTSALPASSTTRSPLDGLLYTVCRRTGIEPIPVEHYRQTGQA
ncbi:hypothetical protein ACH4OW_07615 [Streptomyces sp. NPDC017056]|uniref:hypothetical protein n=1 Tax=Streptomyces sp. NPDC017056 TaxID=3364973 RepID=UPI0037AE1620